jgi:von Willebrand factor type D domain
LFPCTLSSVTGRAPTTAAWCKRFNDAIKSKTIFTGANMCPNGAKVTQFITNLPKNVICTPTSSAAKISCKPCNGATCGGDPHFMTYDGTAYTYHGQCDLVMATSKDIDGTGLSLDVHARTTIKADWSYVSNAAVKIGNDILEITTDSNVTHYFNGEPNVDFPLNMGNKYTVRKQRIEAFPGEYRTDYMIDLKQRNDAARERGDFLHIRSFKGMLTIDIDAHLTDSMGMLGVSGELGMVKRDLKTSIDNSNTAQMGLEWQVRDTEDKLFNDMSRSPQYPEQCYLPKITSRRLRAQSSANLLMANNACAGVDTTMNEFCIQDVLLTGDVQVAHMYHI